MYAWMNRDQSEYLDVIATVSRLAHILRFDEILDDVTSGSNPSSPAFFVLLAP